MGAVSEAVGPPGRQRASDGGSGLSGSESDIDPGREGGGSGKGGSRSEGVAVGAASPGDSASAARGRTRRRDSLRTSATPKPVVGRRQSSFGSSLALSRPG
eukprot:3878441-Pleurochrysis_carterae.AAC.1